MSDVLLFAWEVVVTLSVFGVGIGILQLLGIRRAPLAVSGMFGVSLWIALGGYINAAHGIRPAVLLPLTIASAAAGAFYAVQGLRRLPALRSTVEWREFRGSAAFWMLATAVILIGILAFGGTHKTFWCTDDLQGYMAMGRKAFQTHSIQPDFFCERRVQAGVGGANFLHSWMLAGGDMRAMAFPDATLGWFLYAASLWALGRRWKVSLAGVSFALLCVPFMTLIKVNLTIIYLSAAAFLVALYLLDEVFTEFEGSSSRPLVLGIIFGAACTTKTPNVTLLFPLLLGAALLYRLLNARARVVKPVVLTLVTAAVVVVPYAMQNKRTAGTYVYPLLGNGIHVSAFHLIPAPAKLGSPEQLIALLLPLCSVLAIVLVCLWKMTSHWKPGARAALLAYPASALVATAASTYGLGGSGADRYTAPFTMPALLIALLIVLQKPDQAVRRWRALAGGCLALAAAYTILFTGVTMKWYRDIRTAAYEAVGKNLPYPNPYMRYVTKEELSARLAYGARIQAALPPGVTAIEDMNNSFLFDFSRNNIYVQDMAGMASPAPGLPLTAGVEATRAFLLQHGVSYIIFDRKMLGDDCSGWNEFLRSPRLYFPFGSFLEHPIIAHSYEAWTRVEFRVSCHEGTTMWEVARSGNVVYDDGRVLVARISG